MTNEFVTVFHGTDHPHKILLKTSWVTLAAAEALQYARVCIINNELEGIHPDRERPWLLVLKVSREDVEWKDVPGLTDEEFNGQRGTLNVSVPIQHAVQLDAHD